MSTNAAITYAFSAGDLIRSADVNTNFSDLIAFLNATGVHVYQAGTITAAALASNAVTTAKILNANVTDSKLASTFSKPSGRQVITYSTPGVTAFTKASYPNATHAKIRVVGAGGGGGGATLDAYRGAGGGGGGYAEETVALSSLAASVNVTVGSGGAGGSFGTGSTGGTSSFGSLLICTGGSGGIANAEVSDNGGAGGVGSGGDLFLRGSYGGGYTYPPGGPAGGGMSPNTRLAPLGGSGIAGANYGGGASGGYRNTVTNRAGGTGADGVVIVELF